MFLQYGATLFSAVWGTNIISLKKGSRMHLQLVELRRTEKLS